LKLKLITHWSPENIKYLISLYLMSQKNTSRQLASQAHRDVESLRKRQLRSELRERSHTNESVTQKSAGGNKAYSFFRDIMELSLKEDNIKEEDS